VNPLAASRDGKLLAYPYTQFGAAALARERPPQRRVTQSVGVNARHLTRTYLKTSKLPEEDADGRELDEAEEVPGVVLPANQ
jgi:hypothetical protein